MKIIAAEANYRTRVDELRENKLPQLSLFPFYYQMPDSAILHNDKNQFYIPDFTNDVHLQVHYVVKINKMGKNIAGRFSSRYYSEISVGINLIAYDLEEKLMSEHLPCDFARSFDNSVTVGHFISKDSLDMLKNIDVQINEKEKLSFSTSKMIKSVDEIIEETSKYFTLKTGDLVLTGTPIDYGSVEIGDKIKVFLKNQELLVVEVC